GSWGAPADVATGSTRAPVAAADPLGHVTALWPLTTSIAFDSRVFDPVAPSLGALPDTSGTAGSPIAFTAAATDLWGNPVSYHWDFGDGAASDGQNVTHAYATEGTYTARVTGTDAAANQSSQAQIVQVAPAPVLVTPPP